MTASEGAERKETHETRGRHSQYRLISERCNDDVATSVSNATTLLNPLSESSSSFLLITFIFSLQDSTDYPQWSPPPPLPSSSSSVEMDLSDSVIYFDSSLLASSHSKSSDEHNGLFIEVHCVSRSRSRSSAGRVGGTEARNPKPVSWVESVVEAVAAALMHTNSITKKRKPKCRLLLHPAFRAGAFLSGFIRCSEISLGSLLKQGQTQASYQPHNEISASPSIKSSRSIS